MVTVNLLPWRPLSRHYRIKILRRIMAGAAVVLLMVTCISAIFFLRNRPAVIAAPSLPQPPADPFSDIVNNAWQLQQMTATLLHTLGCIPHPGLYLTQLTILPTTAQLRGRTDSTGAWLSFIAALQQQWRVQVTELQRPAQQEQSFSLTLTPRALPDASPDSRGIFEIKNHTEAVQKMLGSLPPGLIPETLHLADNDDQPSALQVTGSFSNLARFAASLHGRHFFCATDSIRLVRSPVDIHLIFKWHFPCFERSIAESTLPVSGTDPFQRTSFPFIAEAAPLCAS